MRTIPWLDFRSNFPASLRDFHERAAAKALGRMRAQRSAKAAQPTIMRKRVFVADDNPSIRNRMRLALQSGGLDVCGEAIDGCDAIQAAPPLEPDLIVLDLSMPRMNRLQLACILSESLPAIPIILFTLHENRRFNEQAREAGISSVVLKDQAITDLVEAAHHLLHA